MIFLTKKISLESEGIQVINSGVGEPHNGTPKIVGDAGINGIKNGFTRYTSIKGMMPLRQQIQKNLEKGGLNYDVDSIIVSAGAKPAIGGLLSILTDHGTKVLVPAPYYPPFVTVTNFIDAEAVLVDTSKDRFQLTADRIEEAIIEFQSSTRRIPRVKPKVLILNSPNNPTGAVYSRDNLIEIAKLVEKYDLWVISDESYYEFVYDGEFTSLAQLPGMKERTIIVRALSKGYAMTGWRIGYAVGPSEVMEKLSLYLENMYGCPSSVSQCAAIEALKNDNIPQLIQEEFSHNKVIVSSWLKGREISFAEPDGAFYFFADFSKIIKDLKLKNATELAEYILEKTQVAVTPGISFGSQYKNYLRISYSIERSELIEAIERLTNIL